MDMFNKFIFDMGVEDLPTVGRKYTRYRLHGHSNSRLDRILVSDTWIDIWLGSIQYILNRSFSDCCLIVMKIFIIDWEPKPFKTLNCWFSEKGFLEMVEKWWCSYKVQRKKEFALKEKLKLLKRDLRDWHKEHFGEIEKQALELVKKIRVLDLKDEEEGLEEMELMRRRKHLGDILRLSRRLESIIHQQSRAKWLKEGDGNTKYFNSLERWIKKM